MLLPSDVQLPGHDTESAPLSAALGKYTSNAKKKVGGTFSGLADQLNKDRAVRGVAPGNATNLPDLDLNNAGGLATRGLDSQLYTSLAGTGYDDALKQREFEQNMALAREIGDRMRPSTLEQVFGGLGATGRAGGQLYGAFGKGTPKTKGPAYNNSKLSLYNTSAPNEYSYFMGGA